METWWSLGTAWVALGTLVTVALARAAAMGEQDVRELEHRLGAESVAAER